MPVPDWINGTFEIIGGFFIVLNICKLLSDKSVHGVHWISVGFFTLWGWWNLYFYPSLGQWFSFYGGVFLALVNTTWLILLIKYNSNDRTQ